MEEIAFKNGWAYDDMFVYPSDGASVGEINNEYGEVVKSPVYMVWQPLSFSRVLAANDNVQSQFNQRVYEANGRETVVVDMTNLNRDARTRAF